MSRLDYPLCPEVCPEVSSVPYPAPASQPYHMYLFVPHHLQSSCLTQIIGNMHIFMMSQRITDTHLALLERVICSAYRVYVSWAHGPLVLKRAEQVFHWPQTFTCSILTSPSAS